ncbi:MULTISPECIES: hypothetical protein [unclassified Paraflavitalea]|uniref:hypothetical protein n=1 Tax=unclassified Paraflavitalea TaxID=2798305 RepID=UPI003D355122
MSEAISSMLRKAEGLKKDARNLGVYYTSPSSRTSEAAKQPQRERDLKTRCYGRSAFETVLFTKLVGEFLSDLVVWFLSLGITKDPGLNLFFCALLREHERHSPIVQQLKNFKNSTTQLLSN